MTNETQMDRRTFMKLGGMATIAALTPNVLFASNTPEIFEKSLSFYNIHTGEALRNTYWSEGNYISGALDEINHILRDHRTGEVTPVDANLLDLLYSLRSELDTAKPFQIISGYRSETSNEHLRQNTTGVAKKSLHTLGQAIDINLPGIDLSTLQKVAMHQKKGGVGFYPESNFVHLDVGRVRFW